MNKDITIIYVYYNTPDEILDSINSIKDAAQNLSYEIIIVDNHSSSKIPQGISINKKVKIIKNRINHGYGKAMNQGANLSAGKYLLLINPDTKLTKNSIKLMFQKMEKDEKIGIIGPQILNEDKKILPSISQMPFFLNSIFAFSFLNKLWKKNPFSNNYWLYDLDRTKEQVVEVVSGACMFVKKDLFKKIEGFDERFFMYFEEADICLRVKREGFKVIYYPLSKIIHSIGRSSNDKEWIEEKFNESRFKFIKKYNGIFLAIIAEIFLRFSTLSSFLLVLLLGISGFLNLYKINELMMFQGDIARDYLAARDMLITGKIPLLGITSSVTWLHQGPLSIYFIGMALLTGKFNPVAPAIFYGILGVLSTFVVYYLGRSLFNRNIGLLAGTIFATSPLVVVNARMPYHTSSIPLFASVFFLILYKVIKGRKYLLPLLFFILGILFQLELSNGILFFLLGLLFFIYKSKFNKSLITKSIAAFMVGIIPFLLYDFTHRFTQTFGFLLWVLNRIRLFFGLTVSHNSTTQNISSALNTIWFQINRIIFPQSQIIVVFLLLISVVILFTSIRTQYKNSSVLILLWIVIPLGGYFIHTQPGTAYFPLLYPAFALLLGFSFYQLISKFKILLPIFLILIFSNAYSIIKSEYFLTTQSGKNTLPPGNYSFGLDLELIDHTTNFIINNSKGVQFAIKGGGFLSKFENSVDNYQYLALYKNGKIFLNPKLIYTIYEDRNEVPKNKEIIYTNNYVYVTKSEKN